MKWFSNMILRYAWAVALIGTLLAIVGGYYSIELYKNLRTDIHELLPTTARSVVDLKEVTQRLESIDNLAVLVFSQHTKASQRFVVDLAKKLEKAPRTIISGIEYRIDRELKFFKDRQALFMDLSDLIRVKKYIAQRISYEKELYNPLNIFLQRELPEPKLDFLALRQKYNLKASFYSNLPEGFFATPDQTKRALLVNLPGQPSGIEAAQRLKATVAQAVEELHPETYAPDLVVKYTGGVQNNIEEQAALVEDLELSTVAVTLIVSIAMLLFYRNIRATLALVLSLFMGTLWTFGLSYYLVGYLNANSAFLGSIVLGNGINFGIIYLARYLEERRNVLNHSDSTQLAMTHTATSTWTAALAAGLSYGSLMLTSFRGFRQFGVIGFVGMVLCWISAFTVLPALLTVFGGNTTQSRSYSKKAPRSLFANSLAYTVFKIPKAIWILSILVTLISIGTLSRLSPAILETNLSKLRNKQSMTEGSGYLSKHIDEIFQHYLSPMVVLPDSVENARKITKILRAKKAKEGPQSLIASVQTLDDFIPEHQAEKIEVFREIRKLLPRRIMSRLSESDQKVAQEFLSEASFKPIKAKDLPPLILTKFTERDGTLGKLVLVEPPLSSTTWGGEKLVAFTSELRTITDSVEPDAPVAGTLAVAADMVQAISYDGPRATLFAFIAVIILVILLFRNIKTISLVLFALILGVIWLGGIILGFDLRINFLNFIALPITFGIGVDYGVNIFQRYREDKNADILHVMRSTGSAVGLCSFTTITGYTSLLIASNQGFVSFGVLAVAGEMTCLIAALLSLPAYLVLKGRKDVAI